MSEYEVDAALERRILERLGLTTGRVEIREEHTNLGFCETCDYPVDGFSVYVDGNLVWPSRGYLSKFGGYSALDDQGVVRGGKLSVFGQFNNWLNNRPWAE